MKGTVKFYNRTKMFGFITGDDGKDYFVHESEIQGSVKDGDAVEFTPAQSEKGARAEKVKKVEKAAQPSDKDLDDADIDTVDLDDDEEPSAADQL